MTDKTYNGWTNYATWRVNLEIFDGMDAEDMGWHKLDKYELAPMLKDMAESLIDDDTKQNSLARDYALAFLQDVNWREIADMLLSEYAEDAA